jgi:hypothetical protein
MSHTRLHVPPSNAPKVHYIELLHTLAGRVAGTDVPGEEEAQLFESLRRRLPAQSEALVPAPQVHERAAAAFGDRRGSSGGAHRGASGLGAAAAADGSSGGAAGTAGRVEEAGAGEGADADEDPQVYTVAHYYAALYVQAAIRGFLQRARGERGGVEGASSAAGGATAAPSAFATPRPLGLEGGAAHGAVS